MRNILNRKEVHPFEEQIQARYGELKNNSILRLQLFTTISDSVLIKTKLTGPNQFNAFDDTYEADDERLCDILDLNFNKVSSSKDVENLKGSESIAANKFLRQIGWERAKGR